MYTLQVSYEKLFFIVCKKKIVHYYFPRFFLENGKKLDIIHNYGHGGTGVTLSYGCAIEVANIAGEIMKTKNSKSKL